MSQAASRELIERYPHPEKRVICRIYRVTDSTQIWGEDWSQVNTRANYYRTYAAKLGTA